MEQANVELASIISTNFTDCNLGRVGWRGATFTKGTKFIFSIEQAHELGMNIINLFEFSWVKSGLSLKEMEGWKVCWSTPFNAGNIKVAEMQKACADTLVMVACRKSATPDILELAAYGPYEAVFKDTGRDSVTGTVANGVKFYFNTGHGMGFAAADLPLKKNNCDIGTEGGETRLCFNLSEGKMRMVTDAATRLS